MELSVFDEIEHLSRKFFVGPGDDDTFRKWGETAVELALEWLKNPEKRKIHADISLPELAKLFNDVNIPEVGENIDKVFQECRQNILNNSVRINNPRYIGHMTTVIPWFSVVVAVLMTSINQNQVKIETALAASYVERQTLTWLHRLIYRFGTDFYQPLIQKGDVALGNMTSGGTIGNLTALAAAREHALPGVRYKGMWKAFQESGYSDIAIIASKRVHYSIKKSAAVLGLGEESVVEISVDQNNKINLTALKEKIAELKKRKVLILAIIGIAGTTETGNIDPLNEIGEIAKKEKIWYHVDAAWGGAILLSKDLRKLLSGIEKADSVVIDGHKLFYLPMAHGTVLFKRPEALEKLKYTSNYILRKGSVDIGQTSLEGSRCFNAVKLWFSLKMLGAQGYNVILKKAQHLTKLMTELIDRHPHFERTSHPEICIVTYRYVPIQWRKKIEDAHNKQQVELVEAINDKLNIINVELQKRQREKGKSFVSRTTMESTGYDQDIVVLRAVLTNLLTRSEFLLEILEEQQQIGEEVLMEKFPFGI